MRRRTDRYAMDVNVELFAAGEGRRVGVQDVSRSGMFLRMTPPLPVGEQIHVAMFFEGRQLATPARVVHGLGDDDARALGRRPGIGIAFDRPTRHADTMFLRAVERLLSRRERVTAPALHVVVADPSTRLLERLSTELAAAGCTVATATNGLEALGACMRRQPDVIVVDRALPVFDGYQLLGELAHRDELRHVPVIVMSQDANDLAIAFERGAKDFIHKPFAAVELLGRCGRVTKAARERVMMRGDLRMIGLPALLVMLEQERMSARLELTLAGPLRALEVSRGGGERRGPRSGGPASELTAWIELAGGSIIGAGSTGQTDLRATVMSLLDWQAGEFCLVSTPATAPARAQIAMPVTYLLMEHARISDETRQRARAIA